jgi:uncharacterized protein (DUF1501 family)
MSSRRKFLNLDYSSPQQATDKNANDNPDILIYIFQRGAADGLNLVVPHGDSNYYAKRPNLAIPAPGTGANATIDLDGVFGLNPDLSALLPIYDNQDLAMVHACGSLEGSHSHFKTQAFVDRGTTDSAIGSGWLARYVNSYDDENSTAFKSVAMNSATPKSLDGANKAVAIGNIENFSIIAPESETDLINNNLLTLFSGEESLDKVAQATFSAIDSVAEINPNDFPVENNAQYPDSGFANKLKDLAILIKSGIGVETASIDIGGWDTHDAQAPALTQLARDYANSVAAFYYDMGEQMANISIITITEFGRRVAENGSGGTDHGTGNVAFIMGGGVNGGKVYTDWPGLSQNDLVGPGDLAPTTDFRTIISECLDKRLYFNDFETTFPGFVVPEYLGLFETKP